MTFKVRATFGKGKDKRTVNSNCFRTRSQAEQFKKQTMKFRPRTNPRVVRCK